MKPKRKFYSAVSRFNSNSTKTIIKFDSGPENYSNKKIAWPVVKINLFTRQIVSVSFIADKSIEIGRCRGTMFGRDGLEKSRVRHPLGDDNNKTNGVNERIVGRREERSTWNCNDINDGSTWGKGGSKHAHGFIH